MVIGVSGDGDSCLYGWVLSCPGILGGEIESGRADSG